VNTNIRRLTASFIAGTVAATLSLAASGSVALAQTVDLASSGSDIPETFTRTTEAFDHARMEVMIPMRDGDRWRAVFGRDTGATGPPWEAAGDGHATVASQNWLSPQERDRLVGPTLMVDGGHFSMILEPETQRRMVEFLLE